jgi:hypothetical protein
MTKEERSERARKGGLARKRSLSPERLAQIAAQGGRASLWGMSDAARSERASWAARTRWGRQKTASPIVNDLMTEGAARMLKCRWCLRWSTPIGIMARESGIKRLRAHVRGAHPAHFAEMRAQQRREASLN